MNEILPEFFAENVRRLALGLEPLDAPALLIDAHEQWALSRGLERARELRNPAR